MAAAYGAGDAHEQRLARLAARLPPAEVPADARVELELWMLSRAGIEALRGPVGTPLPALVQGAVDLLRSIALRAAVTDDCRTVPSAMPGVRALVAPGGTLCGPGADLPDFARRPELELLYLTALVVEVTLAMAAPFGAPQTAADRLEALALRLKLAAMSWAHTGGPGSRKRSASPGGSPSWASRAARRRPLTCASRRSRPPPTPRRASRMSTRSAFAALVWPR
jgi:hypothetical protein